MSEKSACPVDHTKFDPNTLSPDHPFYQHAQMHKMKEKKEESACPVDHTKFDMSTLSKDHPFYHHVQKHAEKEELNPRNMMPTLSQEPHPTQQHQLPTQRTMSTIPKSASTDMDPERYGDKDDKFWVYPSPQQFYNALKRKGWETPEQEVPVMVDIHNFLNEECWQEILKWERLADCNCSDPKLVKFQGRPNELSPKARLLGYLGTPKPFDRHDWYVDRCGKKTVRYVIDYYSGHGDDTVFQVDVRPALDNVGNAYERVKSYAQPYLQRWKEKWTASAAPNNTSTNTNQ